jgi:hypothetical protein
MTIIACARRKTDGLLTWAQSSPQAPDQNTIIQKGVNSFGGVADDWAYTELTSGQYATVRAAMPGRSFLTFSTDPETQQEIPNLTSKPAPLIASDKSQIEDNGVDEASITFDVGALSFEDDVTFIVTGPDGAQQAVVKTAAAGVAAISITTLLPGSISIDIRAEAFGDGIINLEGV